MKPIFAVLGLSGTELIIVLVAILVLFGAKKIPEFAKGLGKGINEFKKASREVTDSIENESATAPKTPPASITAPAQPTTPPPETKVI
jgi:sec-independent protein translocase protein TatA